MNEILRIAGKEVDLIPKSIERTIQINDLGSAESRESSYSQTIQLPKTSRNQMIFNFLGVSGNMSKVPYIQLSCDYIVDGIPLIINGFTEVKATKEYYEVVIYDGVIDLAEKLKGKTLSSLNYSDLNHFSSLQNFISSFENTEGYIYALGDFGLGLPNIKVERTVPSIYTHTLWNKVFSQLGVKYFGNFFTQNEDFKTEVVTPPQGFRVVDLEPTITPIGSYDTTSVLRNEISQDFIFRADEKFGFTTTFESNLLSFGSNGIITISQTGRIRINIDLSYSSLNGYNSFQVILNSSAVKVLPLESLSNTSVIELNLSVEQGDEIYFKISGSDTSTQSGSGGGGESTIENHYAVSYNASASITFSELTGGYLVDFNEMIGDLPLIDFIKDVMQRYGLIIKPVKGTEDYEFIQFENLLNDRKRADDWSDKLVDIEAEVYGIPYAKKNLASYEYAEGIEVPTHDGILSIENENAEAEKTLFKSPYTIPSVGRFYRGHPLYLHPVWEWDEDDNGNPVVKVKEAPIKTFRIKRYPESVSIYHFDDTNGTTHTGDTPYLSLEDMSMQYFLNVYYKAYRFAVNTYKEVDATFYFSLLDIHNLDLFKLKYLKQTGKFYYLNELQHNAGGEVSKGKLIEINEFSYNLPVQTLGSYTYNLTYGSTRNVSLLYLTSYTAPPYNDPENDSPMSVKFISGFNPNIKLYQAGVEITDDTEIPVNQWAVTMQDLSTTTDAHQESFEFMIKDEGSESFGTQVGTFNVSVYAYVNQVPIARAGDDAIITIEHNAGFSVPHLLDGSDSSDITGNIVSYEWQIISKPLNSLASINNSDTTSPTANIEIPQEVTSLGTYTIELTVTDDFGLTGTDTLQLTVQENEIINP